MEPNTKDLPPWERSDAFPEKPAGSDYGFVQRGNLVPCSREELVRRCREGGGPQIDLAWHPDSPRIVPVTGVSFLSDAIKSRIKREVKRDLWLSVLKLGVFGVLAVFFSTRSDEFLLFAFLALVLGAVPLFNGFRTFRRLGRGQWEVRYDASAERWQAWVRLRPATGTYLIAATLVIVWLFQFFCGQEESIMNAGLLKPEVRRGEWWRLLTGVLVHGNLLHLFFNVAALRGLGRLTEVLSSRFHLTFVFVVSALTGSIFSLILLPDIPTVGASGGLLGLFGFLIVLGRRRRSLLPRGFTRVLVLNIALIAAMGAVLHSMVDNAAHFGGFLSGVVAGMILVRRNDPEIPLRVGAGLRIAGYLAMLIVAGGAVFAVVRIVGVQPLR
jgi:membrane associated rhomboid family serine protease